MLSNLFIHQNSIRKNKIKIRHDAIQCAQLLIFFPPPVSIDHSFEQASHLFLCHSLVPHKMWPQLRVWRHIVVNLASSPSSRPSFVNFTFCSPAFFCIVVFLRAVYPQVVVSSPRGCFTCFSGGSPSFAKKLDARSPSPNQKSFARGWEAAGGGGMESASAGGSYPSKLEWLQQCRAQRLAANACKHHGPVEEMGCYRMPTYWQFKFASAKKLHHDDAYQQKCHHLPVYHINYSPEINQQMAWIHADNYAGKI